MADPLKVSWPSVADFQTALKNEIEKGGLLIRGASVAGAAAGAEVQLEAEIAKLEPITVTARIAAVVPGVGVAVMFDAAALDELRSLEHAEPEEAKPPSSLTERLRGMNPNEKMSLALSGNRDERLALLRDPVKLLHVYVLKNPRIGLEEVTAAAKNPQLSPEALKMIAEHREWSSNPTVCTALVRNPKTPLPLALRLLDKVPMSDIRALAKGGAREQVVHAARRKVTG